MSKQYNFELNAVKMEGFKNDYIIVDRYGEIVNDANGYGFKTIETAKSCIEGMKRKIALGNSAIKKKSNPSLSTYDKGRKNRVDISEKARRTSGRITPKQMEFLSKTGKYSDEKLLKMTKYAAMKEIEKLLNKKS